MAGDPPPCPSSSYVVLIVNDSASALLAEATAIVNHLAVLECKIHKDIKPEITVLYPIIIVEDITAEPRTNPRLIDHPLNPRGPPACEVWRLTKNIKTILTGRTRGYGIQSYPGSFFCNKKPAGQPRTAGMKRMSNQKINK